MDVVQATIHILERLSRNVEAPRVQAGILWGYQGRQGAINVGSQGFRGLSAAFGLFVLDFAKVCGGRSCNSFRHKPPAEESDRNMKLSGVVLGAESSGLGFRVYFVET